MMPEDPYVFLAIDYYATGEGRSIFLLITRAYPRKEDYETSPTYDFKTGYTPGVLKSTPVDIALREMQEQGVDPYFMHCVENLDRTQFLERYKNILPEFVTGSIDNNPGNFKYYVNLHYNYS